MADGDDTPEKTSSLKPAWAPGQSGNPKGRPKGARNKLGDAFLSALLKDFEEHGEPTIAKVRAERPQDYVKVIASTLPKEMNVKVNPLEEMADDELIAAISALKEYVSGHGTGTVQ